MILRLGGRLGRQAATGIAFLLTVARGPFVETGSPLDLIATF